MSTEVGTPFYKDKQLHRSVVLVDDDYQWEKQIENQFVAKVVGALKDAELIVLPLDILGTVSKLIVDPDSKWAEEAPAPSAWVIDIELKMGRELLEDICDGIGLARHIRSREIKRPNDNSVLTDIPIFFLTRYHLDTVLQDNRDASTRDPFQRRIEEDVKLNWRFFNKSILAEGTAAPEAIVEEFTDGTTNNYSIVDFAKEVAEAAENR